MATGGREWPRAGTKIGGERMGSDGGCDHLSGSRSVWVLTEREDGAKGGARGMWLGTWGTGTEEQPQR